MASRRRLHGQSTAGQKGAAGEAEATGRNPAEHAKCGVKRHLLTDGKEGPLATVLPGANHTDMKSLGSLLDTVVLEPPHALTQPPHLCLDRGYDSDACRT
ncbi:MAG TPA: transposase [Ktedonobacteraceae bacterium]|nr:transposase [Ktedonobacteraceae bacterium]